MNLDDIKLTTERGNELFQHENRLWRKESMSKNGYISQNGSKRTTYYVCNSNCCSARLSLVQPICPLSGGDVGAATVKKGIDYHILTCTADEADIMRLKGKKLVETLVKSGQKTIPQAVGEVQNLLRLKYGVNEACLLGTNFQLKRRINDHISSNNGHSPSTFAAWQSIPKELTTTRDDKPHLLVFKDYIDENGTADGVILVFATTSDLENLFRAEVVLIDGTFKIKPSPYARVRGAQVFTVNTFIGVFPSKRMMRRVLAILPKKSEHCYWTFWRLTLEAAEQSRNIDISAPNSIKWKELSCDFEIGMHNAFLNVAYNVLHLPLILLACCHMHYCSSLIKKVKELGLAIAYQNEVSGWRYVMSLFFALAFLPAKMIPPVYVHIRENVMIEEMRNNDQVSQFLIYYENTYIDNPVIPLESWSVFERDDQSKRTTNDLEGKHW